MRLLRGEGRGRERDELRGLALRWGVGVEQMSGGWSERRDEQKRNEWEFQGWNSTCSKEEHRERKSFRRLNSVPCSFRDHSAFLSFHTRTTPHPYPTQLLLNNWLVTKLVTVSNFYFAHWLFSLHVILWRNGLKLCTFVSIVLGHTFHRIEWCPICSSGFSNCLLFLAYDSVPVEYKFC